MCLAHEMMQSKISRESIASCFFDNSGHKCCRALRIGSLTRFQFVSVATVD
jgi:hypothetical protein